MCGRLNGINIMDYAISFILKIESNSSLDIGLLTAVDVVTAELEK